MANTTSLNPLIPEAMFVVVSVATDGVVQGRSAAVSYVAKHSDQQ